MCVSRRPWTSSTIPGQSIFQLEGNAKGHEACIKGELNAIRNTTDRKSDRFSYDQDCEDLAVKFLDDSTPAVRALPEAKEKLAQTIQDAIEDWLREAEGVVSL